MPDNESPVRAWFSQPSTAENPEMRKQELQNSGIAYLGILDQLESNISQHQQETHVFLETIPQFSDTNGGSQHPINSSQEP